MIRPARSARAFGATSLLVGLLGVGCKTEARGAYFEQQLRDGLADKLGPVATIACPDRIPIETTVTSFLCQVELTSGDHGAVRVTLDREGSLSWQTER